jgi:hypothetical protein
MPLSFEAAVILRKFWGSQSWPHEDRAYPEKPPKKAVARSKALSK